MWTTFWSVFGSISADLVPQGKSAITRDDTYIQYLPKVVWILIIIFVPTLGSIVWLVVGPGQNAPRAYTGPTNYGEYERPGRAVAQDPAADEAFLRQCRERAEQQRRIAKHQRRDIDPS
ncbi:PLDc_N domain-containing protein [Rhodococcus erythropolis]|nr:PLDc_N domain-containing protein [Rhodococcus erythropolis]